jgi:hypothetical protein
MSSTDVTTPNLETQSQSIESIEEKDKPQPVNGDANKDPFKKYQLQWQEYYASLGNDKQKLITKLAPKEEFSIPFTEGEPKVFKRVRLSTKHFVDLERRRAQFRKEKDPEKSTDILMDLYQKVAEYGLRDPDTNQGMTKEEYESTVWEDAKDQPGIKTILDAVNHRAVYGGAYFQPKPGGSIQ